MLEHVQGDIEKQRKGNDINAMFKMTYTCENNISQSDACAFQGLPTHRGAHAVKDCGSSRYRARLLHRRGRRPLLLAGQRPRSSRAPDSQLLAAPHLRRATTPVQRPPPWPRRLARQRLGAPRAASAAVDPGGWALLTTSSILALTAAPAAAATEDAGDAHSINDTTEECGMLGIVL